jgi:hypothetical protein
VTAKEENTVEEPHSGLVGSPIKYVKPDSKSDEECSEADHVPDLINDEFGGEPMAMPHDDYEARDLEEKIMDLNKRAMEHLGREQLYGYGTIDET